MIKKIPMPHDDLAGFEACGTVTAEDYKTVLHPLFDEARAKGKKVNFLFYLGPEFESFTPGAGWEDMKLGLQHLGTMGKCAVVTDHAWLRGATRFFGAMIPCPVQVFPNKQLDDAKQWLDSGEIALNYTFDADHGVLKIDISAPLSSNQFGILASKVDQQIEKKGHLNGLVIHAKKFPGWQNLGSLISHITFVKDHHKKIEKVAICSDSALTELIPDLAKHFVEAKVQHFDFDKLEDAMRWARA